ncbi:LysR family transcriptional regulator [Pseudomonas daroniae]|uniref:LysR family transcriptional regulator n=1 Tax=Phytopseudomonas daroniae TaxID=2487519 RepID=A0A4Q9QLH4_9GAMM|nr:MULTISPECIES: LysR family transcriptional regulator [Pseudomonas]TBU79805.1 LysR family transcriptional regulator [Pseudomonas daroniae]TBU82476.1 LysR family transcriptional regulator [Pseudomonas sp. FRB 228]TBU91811.1 LysR family transcriptional regulator [Pseudomonas daroniae]
MPFDERILNGMGVLAAVVNNGSFASAAQALDMTPSGVSRAVQRFENRLGIRVFDRTTRAVSLTDEGQQLFDHILPLLEGLEEATTQALLGHGDVSGKLRVNVHPFFSQLILGSSLDRFLRAHPNLTLDLVAREQLGDMVADGFDLAIRFGEPKPSRLVAKKILETRILTVASPAYIERYGIPSSPLELQNGSHNCIQFRDPETSRPFTWAFRKGKEQFELALGGQLLVNDVGTLHGACLAGYGIAQVMALGAGHWLSSGELVSILQDWSDERFPLYALYPSRKHLPAKTRAFMAFVESIVD